MQEKKILKASIEHCREMNHSQYIMQSRDTSPARSRPAGPSPHASAAGGPAYPRPKGPHTPRDRGGDAISLHISAARWSISPHVRGHGTIYGRGRAGPSPRTHTASGAISLHVSAARWPSIRTSATTGLHIYRRVRGRRGHLPARPRPTLPHTPCVRGRQVHLLARPWSAG